MVAELSVVIHENGLVITPIGFGCGTESRVYEKKNIEEALLDLYSRCCGWRAGTKIIIQKCETREAKE